MLAIMHGNYVVGRGLDYNLFNKVVTIKIYYSVLINTRLEH
jgi:hypothetical protein